MLDNYTKLVIQKDDDPSDGRCSHTVLHELEAKAAKVPLGATQIFNGAKDNTVSPFPFGI